MHTNLGASKLLLKKKPTTILHCTTSDKHHSHFHLNKQWNGGVRGSRSHKKFFSSERVGMNPKNTVLTWDIEGLYLLFIKVCAFSLRHLTAFSTQGAHVARSTKKTVSNGLVRRKLLHAHNSFRLRIFKKMLATFDPSPRDLNKLYTTYKNTADFRRGWPKK